MRVQVRFTEEIDRSEIKEARIAEKAQTTAVCAQPVLRALRAPAVVALNAMAFSN